MLMERDDKSLNAKRSIAMIKQTKTNVNLSKKTRTIHNLAGLAIVAILLCSSTFAAGNNNMHMYLVTIQNLTEGQALTPPLVTTHSFGLDLFDAGSPASAELQAIAENGNSGPMNKLLGTDARVLDAVESTAGPLVPASNPGNTDFVDSVSLKIAADPCARFVSWVSMLICTNDGFTGLSSLPLPAGGSRVILTSAYDAGTEMNTEDYADLVPPCQALFGVTSEKTGTGETNPALAENGVIAYHEGIQGTADLAQEDHDWNNPVAKITITAIDEQANRFSTTLNGAAEVPPVFTFAGGSANFRLHMQRQELDYELIICNISGVTQAHIHNGLPSENAGVVAFLLGPQDASGFLNCKFTSGTVTADDLIGDYEGDWEGFVTALLNGELYVNVHTHENPPGEIRGQIGSSALMGSPMGSSIGGSMGPSMGGPAY